jgi:hypothetical protein
MPNEWREEYLDRLSDAADKLKPLYSGMVGQAPDPSKLAIGENVGGHVSHYFQLRRKYGWTRATFDL